MEDRNQTDWKEFILVGFSDLLTLRMPLFFVLLLTYLVTIAGNVLVMYIIYCDLQLHTPMYFFLSNLSFVDICYTSITFPKMLVSSILLSTHITLQECLLQVYFFLVMIVIEFFLLTIMSFDRYVAICDPLNYTIIMSRSTCVRLACGAWILGFMEPVFHTALLSTFSYCKTPKINHFFCDITALLQLSCTNTHTIEIMTFVLGVIVLIASCLLILTSYIKIISAILKINQTATGKWKVFSTCTSHLTVVILYYGVLIFVYLRPASMYSSSQNKIFSVIYTGVIPMCNPIIYTLKNKDFSDAMRRRRGRRCCT